MHIVNKKERSCRGTVDLYAMNAAMYHWIHLTESTFVHASRIPACTLKSTVPPAKSRELTMLLTPWGRYRYLVNPQGDSISENAYTIRYNKIMEELECWVRMSGVLMTALCGIRSLETMLCGLVEPHLHWFKGLFWGWVNLFCCGGGAPVYPLGFGEVEVLDSGLFRSWTSKGRMMISGR